MIAPLAPKIKAGTILETIGRMEPAGGTAWEDCLEGNNAEDRTRTGTGCPTRPSNVRVYQFRHFGLKNIPGFNARLGR
ncbi:MAG: hypothetical protein QOJ16_4757 [Acidobacteriota bacterium]|nr:hypothetical protein [Acidobacteriota bacterium]